MNDSYTVKKSLQTTEEKQPVTYKPLIIGNQCFIVAQQNVRRTEDIAFFSFGTLGPNGELIVLDPAHYASLLTLFLNQENQDGTLIPSIPTNNLNTPYGGIIQNRILSFVPQIFPQFRSNQSILKPFRFNCTRSTSSTELSSQYVGSYQQPSPSSKKNYIFIDLTKNEPDDLFGSSSTDRCEYCGKLNAREQLKKRKLLCDNGF